MTGKCSTNIEAENTLLSTKILLLEKELFSRENDLSSDDQTISTLRDHIDSLKENIGSDALFQHKAEELNMGLSLIRLTDKKWESIEEDDLIEAEIGEVFQGDDDSSSSKIAADCPLSEKYAENDFKLDIKAKYPTRKDKFLTSVLMNGPNNQLIGLRETIFIAIKLNRSYILPKFFKHDHADPTAVKDPFAEISASFRVSPSKQGWLKSAQHSSRDFCVELHEFRFRVHAP
ncbi:unnamed protein product [Oikopleura dioica]|uniref:Uncharacterized protein n=1 Tax=Oikopleura dioica TaxID=34765 RepID=E4YHN1_OIKDI|nr:unnamed protein product [Oikopleura dioica]